ncbi:Retrovirus-related Pol polyprotein from transposon 17.6 [Nosema granulosis]|uniref:Retrovirus-related Pol polyprotein from transposon 17.6 n=1 Tax=Nosema granulosis TaxID=83296 RepID=A0A9P6GZP8_9MICR|nr:Retrovirus-related Pol polyprotein from transposon 17.6 [Nosema granulosis]
MISAFSKNYSVTDKELLAVVKGIEHYRHYLLGKHFTLRTDHKSITYLWDAKNPTSRLLRWSMKLQEYSFKIEYVRGEDNIADGCSRINEIRQQRKGKTEIQSDAEKRELIEEYHKMTGHVSANNVKFLLCKRYHWPDMFNEIDEYVKNCKICQKAGPP